MYHLPRLCRTMVPEIHVRPEMLHVFLYTDVLTCVIYNCTQLNSMDNWSYSLSAIKVIDEYRYVS